MAKKIINNRMYNTETAKQLGYWSNGYTPSDFYFAVVKKEVYIFM